MTGRYDVHYKKSKCGVAEVSMDGLRTLFVCDSDIVSDDVLRLFCFSGGKAILIGVMTPENGRLGLRRAFTKNTLTSIGLDKVEKCVLAKNADEASELYKTAPSFEQTPQKSVPREAKSGSPQADARPEQFIMPKKVIYDDSNLPEPSLLRKAPYTISPKPAPHDPPVKHVAATPEPEPFLQARQTPSSPMRESPQVPDFPSLNSPPPARIKSVPEWQQENAAHKLFKDEEMKSACSELRGALTRKQDGITMLAVPCRGDEPFPMMPIFCFGKSEIIAGEPYVVFGVKDGEIIT